MRNAIRTTFSAAVLVYVSAALSPVTAQGSTKCTVLTAAEIEQVTEAAESGNLKPMISVAPQVPQGVSECDYLGISFSLTAQMSKQWFDATRTDQAKGGTKVTPVSGVGDDAYYWYLPAKSLGQMGIAFRVGQSRLVIMDLVNSDAEAEQVKPVLLALAKAAAPK